MRALVIGCGYIGMPLCLELARQGHQVFGVQRSATAAAELVRAAGVPIQADITRKEDLEKLPLDCDWIVDCVASSGGGAEEYARVYREGMRNLLERFQAHPPKKFVYTSSTSVYAQDDGSLVTEDSPTDPAAETSRILPETERLLLEKARTQGFPGVVLRLAGIYGPGRGYWLKQFLQGTARLEGDGSRWLNMIHRDDVVGAVIAALDKGAAGEVYNVADDEPVMQRNLFAWLSERLGRPMPGAATEEPLRRRGLTNKRVSNAKLRKMRRHELRYPTFREGFEAELRQGSRVD